MAARARCSTAGGPFFFGADGWQLVPGHFAERHGLIVLIALGESIVAIGAGSAHVVDAGVVVGGGDRHARRRGAVVAVLRRGRAGRRAPPLERARRAASATRSRATPSRTCTSRWSPGIILVALGLKKTLRHVGAHLDSVPAAALLGGAALYLLAHVAFRWRNVHRFSAQRLIVAILCVALVPLATRIPALATLTILAVVLIVLIAYERVRFHELRQRLLHQVTA